MIPKASLAASRCQPSPVQVTSSPVLTAYVAMAVFMISLQSFYFPSGGSWLCYLGALMLWPLAIGRRPALEPVLIVGLLLGFTTIQALSGREIEIKTAFGMLFSAATLIIVGAGFRDRKSVLLNALTLCLSLHLAAFGVQVLYWMIRGEVLDLTGALGFEPASWSSTLKSLVVAGVRIPRFTGLLNEPGTYSAVMIGLTTAHYGLRRSLSPVSLLALMSVVATASLGGSILVVVLLVVVGLDRMLRRGRTAPGTGAMIASLAIGSALAMAALFRKRSAIGDAESAYHAGMVKWITAYENLSLTGLNSGDLPHRFIINDIGVWADVLVRWGVIGLAGLALYLGLVVGGVQALLMAPLMLTKLKLTYPLLFLAIATVRLGPVKTRAPG